MSATRLDRQIGRWLSWYPAEWRAANGEALRGSLLDEAEAAGRTRLTFGDRLALASAGLTAREVRRRRLTAVLASVALVVYLAFYAAFITWSPGYTGPGALWGFSNPVMSAGVVALAAAGATLLVRPRVALLLGVVAASSAIGFGVAGPVLGWQGPGIGFVTLFVGLLILVVAPFQRSRPFLVAVAAVIAIVAGGEVAAYVVIPNLAVVIGSQL